MKYPEMNDLAHRIEFELYRGIYSLATLLALRFSTDVKTIEKQLRLRQTGHRALMMKNYAIHHHCRMNLHPDKIHLNACSIGKFGSDFELEYMLTFNVDILIDIFWGIIVTNDLARLRRFVSLDRTKIGLVIARIRDNRCNERAIISEAIYKSAYDIIRYLDELLDFSQLPPRVLNAGLLRVAVQGIISMVDFFLQRGATDRNGALHQAVAFGHLDLLRHLLDENSVHIGQLERFGRIAADNGHIRIIKFLVEKGAKNYELMIFGARHKGHTEIVDYLSAI